MSSAFCESVWFLFFKINCYSIIFCEQANFDYYKMPGAGAYYITPDNV